MICLKWHRSVALGNVVEGHAANPVPGGDAGGRVLPQVAPGTVSLATQPAQLPGHHQVVPGLEDSVPRQSAGASTSQRFVSDPPKNCHLTVKKLPKT